ncbi:SAM-dependent methyltransferase [Rhizobacter sp. SG703]|uniref:class I SAM-dependent methyltransferase n=1 Tax=Rhizobacter sp. SG703 TaxID=2587140 RepID=UPI0014467BDF|nr:SAM-dependent methyltransferase [Rhizobacter sp. SG703]NKI95093.1 putative nicotinamide N-methyase [Rhizobacter sp. SG703]
MPGYLIKHEDIAVDGVPDLHIRSLLDRQQFSDPQGLALSQGISSAAWPLFGLLWPSGLQLAGRMAARTMVAGERILEIGCGLALASLVSHRRGADVTASDCHPLAAEFLAENLRLNQLPPMAYRHGQWSESATDLLPPVPQDQQTLSGRFELVIGSDILYERDDGGLLAGFIGRHVAQRAEVWIVDPNRGNRAKFSKQMAAMGFSLQEEPLQQAADATHAAYKGRLLVYRNAD